MSNDQYKKFQSYLNDFSSINDHDFTDHVYKRIIEIFEDPTNYNERDLLSCLRQILSENDPNHERNLFINIKKLDLITKNKNLWDQFKIKKLKKIIIIGFI